MEARQVFAAILIGLLAALIILLLTTSCQIPDLFGPRIYDHWTAPSVKATPKVEATCVIGIGIQ